MRDPHCAHLLLLLCEFRKNLIARSLVVHAIECRRRVHVVGWFRDVADTSAWIYEMTRPRSITSRRKLPS